MKTDLLKKIIEIGAIEYGDFTLRSGDKTNIYCNIKKVYGYPDLVFSLAGELSKRISAGTTGLAVSGIGGITLGTLVSHITRLPLTIIRDKQKEYGSNDIFIGYRPTKKDLVCILDDVYTTGSSVAETKNSLLGTECSYSKTLVILNRSNDKTVEALFDIDQITA